MLSASPTQLPSCLPSSLPSYYPSIDPTSRPSPVPTVIPSVRPSLAKVPYDGTISAPGASITFINNYATYTFRTVGITTLTMSKAAPIDFLIVGGGGGGGGNNLGGKFL